MIDVDELACSLGQDWGLSRELSFKLAAVMERWEEETRMGIHVLSGMRTRAEQEALIRAGAPAAPVELSTHTTCPSQGADLGFAAFVTTTMKGRFGLIVTENGLRWGGGSPVDPSTGIPSDWNHVDTGPRS